MLYTASLLHPRHLLLSLAFSLRVTWERRFQSRKERLALFTQGREIATNARKADGSLVAAERAGHFCCTDDSCEDPFRRGCCQKAQPGPRGKPVRSPDVCATDPRDCDRDVVWLALVFLSG